MKIYGPNRPNINPYYEQQQKLTQAKHKQSKDRLEISDEAMKLQNTEQAKEKRTAYVAHIKQQIDAGEYKVDYEQTAKKFVSFFTK